MEKKNIIVIIFEDDKVPKNIDWSAIYKIDREKFIEVDKALTKICDSNIFNL